MLYLGGYELSRCPSFVDRRQIRAMVNCTQHLTCHFKHEKDKESKQAPVIDYHHVTINDTEDDAPTLASHLASAVEFIDTHLSNGTNVYVHCMQGISRSASFVVAYIMHKTHCSFHEALDFVRTKRSIANPNPGFARVLASIRH